MDLVEAIACAKVKCVEGSIESCHRLQNEVGSYALMAHTGFENIDFLTCKKEPSLRLGENPSAE